MEATTKQANGSRPVASNAGSMTGNGTQPATLPAGDDRCSMCDGTLPCPCAPLVFPYVPMQENDPARYSNDDALRAGTLFPGLRLPFHRELESRFPAVNTALSELMALDFAIHELGLYLTTHRNDREALDLYWSYVRLGREGRDRYQAQYGPLMKTDITPGSFRWLDDPWPWDLGGND